MNTDEEIDKKDEGHGEPGIGDNSDLAKLLDELEGQPIEELLQRARKKQLVDLLAKLEAGLLTHQEHAVLRNLLRDNGATLAPLPPPEDGDTKQQGQSGETVMPPPPRPIPLPTNLEDPDYDL